MKKLLIILLMSFLSLKSYSQNGGQFYENNVILLEYIGYSSGKHAFKVCNKQTCNATIRTKADQDPAIDVQVSGKTCAFVYVERLTPVNIKFRVKAETSCPSFVNPDMGWLELNTSNFALPLVESNLIRFERGSNKITIFIERGILTCDFGQLTDVQNLLIYDQFGRKLYSQRISVYKKSQVDLNMFLAPGINILRISLEQRPYEIFIFKILHHR